MPDPAALSPLAALARRHDPDRFLCALFAPPERRETLFLLIAVNHELARARQAASNAMTALIRLQWWRDAVTEAGTEAPPRRHEVATPLAEALRQGHLSAEDLQAMIDAREAETEEDIPTESAFLAYLRGTAGGFAVAAGRALGAPAGSLPGLQALGAAYGMAGVLRSIPQQSLQGRSLLPAETLARHGLTPADMARDPRQQGAAGAVAELARQGQALLAEGRARLGRLPRGAVAAALPARLAARDLKTLAGGGYDPTRPPAPRGLGDRLSVAWAGLAGRP
ncbi:squalene/phytoene synthase family protein [Pseudoroseomonas cervicalis]|uniref:squalene/phytoene synthase family protein n=1 Tax=Teichococcus cervicalis TaxID=204525 RepID=UPI0022F1BCD3|nr:squalene/phytoene synthase family protein [Pseudoroseomonas cervicalis]WBV41842.1 squalene/phytoene synthase family protein [Pseudoroseomonas cervicalis]